MSFRRSLLALVMVSAAGFAGTALATTPSTCTTDQDCQRGYTCQVYATVATTAPACPPDMACAIDAGTSGTDPATGAGGSSGITPATLSMCMPGPCVSDSDCGTNMVCHAESYSECSGGGPALPPCAAGTKCDGPVEVSPTTCLSKTMSACAFRWQLPCNADADCGDGFVCQPSVSGSCSGSGGTTSSVGTSSAPASAASDGGMGPAPTDGGVTTTPPETCTTTTSFPGSCHAAVPSCDTDADCPGNWACLPVATRGLKGTGVTGAGGASGPAIPKDVTIAPVTMMCSAPNTSPLDVKGGGDGNTGGPETSGTAPSANGGNGGATTVGPTGDTVSGAGSQDSKTPGATNDSAGCSVTPRAAHPGASTALLVLFGLGLVRRNRGRRS